jgi:hypothetical protein
VPHVTLLETSLPIFSDKMLHFLVATRCAEPPPPLTHEHPSPTHPSTPVLMSLYYCKLQRPLPRRARMPPSCAVQGLRPRRSLAASGSVALHHFSLRARVALPPPLPNLRPTLRNRRIADRCSSLYCAPVTACRFRAHTSSGNNCCSCCPPDGELCGMACVSQTSSLLLPST